MGEVVSISIKKRKPVIDHNQMVIDRIQGMPAQPGTPETEKMRREIQDPNVK